MLAAVRSTIVEVQGVGWPVTANRAHEHSEHVDLALGVVRLERDDVAGGVIEQPVDAHRLARAAQRNRRPVADVALPQGAGRSACQRSRVLAPVPSRSGMRSSPPSAKSRRTVEAETAPLSSGRRFPACAG